MQDMAANKSSRGSESRLGRALSYTSGQLYPRTIAHITPYAAKEWASQPKETVCKTVKYLASTENRNRTVESMAILIK